MQGKHHPLGPSTLELRAACPGSFQAEQQQGSDEQLEDGLAEAGNLRHHLAAEGLLAPDRRPVLLGDSPEEDRPLIQKYWGWWEQKYEMYAAGKQCKFLVEKRINVNDRYGTPDAALIIPNEKIILSDLKNARPTPPRWNLQTADYLHGLVLKYGWQGEEVLIGIVHAWGIDEHSFQMAEMEHLWDTIARVVQAAKVPSAPRRPGPHCSQLYCRARENCPERAAMATQVAYITDPVSVMLNADPQTRRALMDSIGIMEKRLDELKKPIREAILQGVFEVPGYRIQATEVKHWLEGARSEVCALAHAQGHLLEDVTPLISPAKATKLLGQKAVSEWIKTTEGTPRIVKTKEGRE